MRLLRLDLLRYGHLTDVSLEFPREAALHVVLGPNEAGKSTALEAIGDALFGFPHQTGRDFLHAAKDLRIGFTLADRAGTAASFQRRKGRQGTLLNEEDRPVPEEALRRFLGGADRDVFERSFGLDGERLREGGRDLLKSGGESGESLLAGLGVMHLHRALAKLDEEAKALVGDGRGRRQFSIAMDAFKQARDAAAEAAVRPAEWQAAEDRLAAIRSDLAEAQREMAALAQEASRLQRIRRVKPRLAELDRAREQFALLADAPRLPAEARALLDRALEARRAAAQDAAREAEAVRRLSEELAALPRDTAVLALQDRIDTLAERRAVVLQAERDLPELRARLDRHHAMAAEAARALGLDGPAEALRERLPPESLRRRAQRLLTDRARLVAQREAAAQALAAAQRAREAAAQALRAAPEPPSPAPLRQAIQAAQREGRLDRELEAAERRLATAAAEATAALAALPLWSGDAAALAACRVPLAAEAEAAARRLAEAEQAAGKARDDLALVAAEIARLQEELADLAAGETVPTRAAIEVARRERDRAWRLLRRMLEGGAAPAPEERAGLPAAPLPEGFEALRDAADRLADRRAEEAQRVADWILRTDRLERARRRHAEAEAALTAAEAIAATALAAWRALWAPAGLEPRAPEIMKEWRAARAEVLRLAAEERQAREACDELAARRAAAREPLAALLPGGPAGPALAPLLGAAELACKAAEEAFAGHRMLLDRLATEEARLPVLRNQAEAAAHALAEADAGWDAAAAALGLAPGAPADAVEAALLAWGRVAEAAEAWREDERRIAGLQQAVEGFAAAVAELLARLPGAAGGEPPAVLALGLARRLAEARKAGDAAEALARRLGQHREAVAAAEQRRLAAEAQIAALREAAGAADEAALDEAIALAARRDRLAEEATALERLLAEQSDGLPEAALRQEAAAVEVDAATARLAEIEARRAALAERLGLLGGERNAAEQALRAMEKGRDAAAHAQAAEQALAEARAAAERYARLHTARSLLRAGIERFRAERQTPLLRDAGAHFALLTGGRYARLAAEEDEKGRVLLKAVRADGTDCAVEALSEGTRDQLYLALRIASVESYAAHAEPLPFIADDLLVQFDDARAAAAIALLAGLGRVTQPILFTHHDHLAELAARQPGVHVQVLPGFAAAAPSEARSAA
ncbi:ATP-binding protein [Roseicella aerolata]|uniref:AAA family ATPase n=1 Tax=Roseicella aerolata TaxID=2883479 RepID=A0A9X1I9W0_9PROT|nr:YhaN family protein [Roseicella aerolata]MCB4820487.1 AAA family ATPase [Roseicella aerolata]